MKKLTYRLCIIALVTCVFTSVVSAQNNSKECMKVGVSMGAIGGNIFPFIDFFKINNNIQTTILLNDINGYPLSGDLSVTLNIAGLLDILKHEHILSWDGAVNSEKPPLRSTGQIIPLIIVPNSFKKTSTGGLCKVKLDTSILRPQEELILIFRNTIPTTDIFNPQHIRNIKLIRAGFENSDFINYPFNPEFVTQMKPFKEIDFRATQFMYFRDTTNNIAWKDRTTPASITQNSLFNLKNKSFAYEHMIQLCNETNSNASLYFPICADENYLFQMANLFKNNLKNKQTITLYPAYFMGLGAIIAEKAKQNPIYKNDYFLALADYTGRAWRIWRNVFGADSSRVLRGIESYLGDSTTTTKMANFHGKGNFELIHSVGGSLWELDSSLLKPTLTANEGYNSILNSIQNNNKNKKELRRLLAFAKIYDAKISLWPGDGPSEIRTSDTTIVYFNETQIKNLTQAIKDSLNNMSVSKVVHYFNIPTFQPNKLNEGGIRQAASYFALVNILPTKDDCGQVTDAIEQIKVQQFQVFPNPTNGELTFTSNFNNIGDKLNVECYNSLGTAVYKGEVNINESLNMLQNQSVGIYNIIIITTEGRKYQHKILKY